MFVALCVCIYVCVLLWCRVMAQNNWDILAEPEILHEMWAEAHFPNNKHLAHLQKHTQTHKTAILGQNLWKQCSFFFRLEQNEEHDKQVAEKIRMSLARTPDTYSNFTQYAPSSLVPIKKKGKWKEEGGKYDYDG